MLVLFMYLVAIFLVVVVWFMPKRLTRQEMYIIWIIVSYIEITVDLSLGHVMDLYYFAQEQKISPEALIVKMIVSPLFGIIFSNYIPKRSIQLMGYLMFWVLFSTFFEWLTIKFGYLTYKNWSLWYSFIFYIVAVLFMRWNLWFIRNTPYKKGT